METVETTEKRLLAEIEALRLQYPDTQDLYREVCVILFFRHGITPTANKLYQLVRKGSMSAPAGEMVGALWQRAQAEAKSTLSTLQEEAEASVEAAQSAAEDALQKLQGVETALDSARQDGAGLMQQVNELQKYLQLQNN